MTIEQRERLDELRERAVEKYLSTMGFSVEEWLDENDCKEFNELTELWFKQFAKK